MSDLTLSMLGGLEADSSGLPLSAADREKLLKKFHDAAAGEGLGAYDLGGRLLGFVGESLRKPLAGIVGEVWKQRKELREIAEKGKDKRDVEGDVELIDHTISWTLHPSVELQANGVKLCTMTFDCKANLKLQGVQLLIRNSWITSIKAGKLGSTITLEYKSLPLMAPCKKTIDLRKSFDLPGGGIRLGGEERPPAI
jgi:hypothetical protein